MNVFPKFTDERRRLMKKTVLIILTLFILLCFSAGASEVIFSESFDDKAMTFDAYGIKLTGGTAEVGKVLDGAVETSALILTDAVAESGVSLHKSFENLTDVVSVEVRFRFQKTMGNLSFEIGKGNNALAKIDVSATGQASVTDGNIKQIFTEAKAYLNTWTSLRFCWYPSENRFDARCASNILEDLKPLSGYEGEGIDYLLIQSHAGRPEVVIDYIIVEEGRVGELDADVRPIEPKYIDTPVFKANGTDINICYNGSWKFFDYKPVIRDSRVLLPFRRAFEMLGLEISYNPEERSATGKNESFEIKITDGSNAATVNGEEKLLDVMPQIIEDSFYVPVRFIAQSLGKKVDWNGEERTVIIND